jgi:hypothetical protein
MAAGVWIDDNTIQLFPSVTPELAGRQDDDDEALDDWLASMTVPQFERILNALMERLGGMHAAMQHPA